MELSNGQLDAEVITLDEKRAGRVRTSQLTFTLYRDIEAEPKKLWVIQDYFGAGELSCIFGPPGSGKSVLAGDLFLGRLPIWRRDAPNSERCSAEFPVH